MPWPTARSPTFPSGAPRRLPGASAGVRRVAFAEQQAALDAGLSKFDALLPRQDGKAAFLALLRRNPELSATDADGMAQVVAQVPRRQRESCPAA